MVKTKIKRAVSFVMATVLSLSAILWVLGQAQRLAASRRKKPMCIWLISLVTATQITTECGDTVTLLWWNGWHTGSSTHTNIKAIARIPVILPIVSSRVFHSVPVRVWTNTMKIILTISQQTELSPAMKSDSLSVVSCSTAIEERFQQAGGRRTKVRQTVLLTLMQHSFLSGKLS